MTGNDTDRTRTFAWRDPHEGAAKAMEMSGLEYLKAMFGGEMPSAPIAEALGFRGVEVEEGRVVFECVPEEYHYNPIGSVHGGLAATLFDSALGCAVHSMLPAGVGYTTLEIKINLLRPLTAKTGRVLCEGNVIHVGKRVATSEARLTDEAGKLYGHATTTCMVFREEAGGKAPGEGEVGIRE